ncbi:MAG: Ig-like domain-containing protein [Thermomicrobiales bacterium]
MLYSRRLLAVVLVLFTIAIAGGPAWAQSEASLPPGILALEVDGQSINSLTSPVTDSSTPEVSGRADGTVTSITLSISNAEETRFAAPISTGGRFRATPPQELPDGEYTLAVNDVQAGTFTISGGVSGDRRPGALLDIARVTPYPADAAESLPALAFLDGRFYSLADEAARVAARNPNGPAAREIERQLAMAGWLQRYESRLAVPNADQPRRFDVQISSFVVEYASGADARTAFDSLDSPGEVEFETVGDESQLTLLAGETPDTGGAYQAARLVFRVGPLLCVIVYADLQNQPPDLTLLGNIGSAVAARGGLVADRQVTPLGSMALRLDLETAIADPAVEALYENRAGALTAIFGEEETTRAARAELLSATTDAFSTTTSGTFTRDEDSRLGRRTVPSATPLPEVAAGTAIAAGDDASATTSVMVQTALYAFASEDEASSWLANERQRLAAAPPGITQYTPLTDAPALADQAAVLAASTTTDSGEQFEGYRILTRSGGIVAMLDVQSNPGVSLRGAVGMMEDQLACIEAQGCAGATSLPGSMFGGRDRPEG